MTFVETPFVFDCEGDQLVAVLALPERPVEIGVVVVVGGPQYRAGSHRQFVHLSRAFAAEGIACLRFDCRGMGDSEGDMRSFESIGIDIKRAAEELLRRVPAVRRIVLCGLCDGASASLMAIGLLPQIHGVIALNPWVRSETSLDRALVRHYYAQRILSRDFWAKLFSGKLGIARAAIEFLRRLVSAFGASGHGVQRDDVAGRSVRYQDRMCDGLSKLHGRVMFILSGKDLTAQEYVAFAASDPRWKRTLANPPVITESLTDADHTFSNETARLRAESVSCRFVLSLSGGTVSSTSIASNE